jgi:hypothetical protein
MVAIRRFSFSALALMILGGEALAEERCFAFRGIAVTPPENLIVEAATADKLVLKSPGITRHESLMALFTPEGEPTPDFTEEEALPEHGFALKYRSQVEHVGSGGPEGSVTGHVMRDGKAVLGFACSTQASDSVDPLWCLESLRTLRARTGGCEAAKAP